MPTETAGTSSELLTPAELAAEYRVARGTVYSWRTRNTGPRALKVGGLLRYRRDDVEAWIEAQSGRAS